MICRIDGFHKTGQPWEPDRGDQDRLDPLPGLKHIRVDAFIDIYRFVGRRFGEQGLFANGAILFIWNNPCVRELSKCAAPVLVGGYVGAVFRRISRIGHTGFRESRDAKSCRIRTSVQGVASGGCQQEAP